MSIGKRKQIQLVYVPSTQATSGEWEQQPKDFYNRWADISNPSGFRDYAIGQTQLGNTKRFLIRFDFGLFPGADWKIKYQGKEWTIQELEKVNEKQFYWSIRATCK